MTFSELAKLSEQLAYRDKLRLAQLLIQLARKEDEDSHPATRAASATAGPSDPELIKYVAARLRKLRPSKKDGVLNSIGAMFQFQGGVSDVDKERILSELFKERHITIAKHNRVVYPDKTSLS